MAQILLSRLSLSSTLVSPYYVLCRSCVQNSIRRSGSVAGSKPELPRGRRFKNAWQLIFGKYLLLTNTLSSGLLMIVGDIAGQTLEHRLKTNTNSTNANRDNIDWSRVGRMFVVGSCQGPLHHYFYMWLDRFIPRSTVKSTIQKIGFDQIFMSPACIVAFFYAAGLLERKSLKDCGQELREKFLTVYTTDWCVWPITQFINFYWLPTHYRVLYINVITMMYNVFLSYVKHSGNETPSP